MSVYLVLYHTDDSQQSEWDRMEQEDQFSLYNREISNAVLDGGSRIISGKEITKEGACHTSDSHISRYLMLEAQDIDEAIELSKGAPLLRQGGRVEVLEVSMAGY